MSLGLDQIFGTGVQAQQSAFNVPLSGIHRNEDVWKLPPLESKVSVVAVTAEEEK